MLAHWGPLIDEAGVDFRLQSSHIAGPMWAESNGVPSLTSKAGAMGLMQVMPVHFTAAELPNAYDPRLNIRKGAALLAGAKAGFRDLVQMASAYNAGGPQGPANGPWTNEAWLAAGRNPSLTSRWGYAAEPGYIDRVVAANNTYIQLQKGSA
jgi:soluble lytic murein transglycosylase-like protein